MNIDPLAEKYFEYSQCSYALNNPLFFTDPDGRRIKIGSNFYTYEKDRNYDKIKNEFERETYKALDYLYSSGAMNITIGEGEDAKTVNILDKLIDDKENTIKIVKGTESRIKYDSNKIKFNPYNGAAFFTDLNNEYSRDQNDEPIAHYSYNSPLSILAHEFIHGYNKFYDKKWSKRRLDISTQGKILDPSGRDFSFTNAEEQYTTTLSNQVNRKLNEAERTNYFVVFYPTKSVTSIKPVGTIPIE